MSVIPFQHLVVSELLAVLDTFLLFLHRAPLDSFVLGSKLNLMYVFENVKMNFSHRRSLEPKQWHTLTPSMRQTLRQRRGRLLEKALHLETSKLQFVACRDSSKDFCRKKKSPFYLLFQHAFQSFEEGTSSKIRPKHFTQPQQLFASIVDIECWLMNQGKLSELNQLCDP